MLNTMKLGYLLLIAIFLFSCRTQTETARPLTIAQVQGKCDSDNEKTAMQSRYVSRKISIVRNTSAPETATLPKVHDSELESRAPVMNSKTIRRQDNPKILIAEKKEKNNSYTVPLGTLLGLFAGSMLAFGRKRRIRLWAAKNKKSARLALVGLHLLLACTGWIAGNLWRSDGIVVPDYVSHIFFGSGLLAVMAYPHKRRNESSNTFNRKRKWLDRILIVAGFMGFFALGSQPLPTVYKYGSDLEKSSIIDKVFNDIPNHEISQKGDGTGEKLVLSFLLMAVAILLGGLIAAFACTFACSGLEMVANMVLYGGLAILAIVFAVVIWAIWREKPPKPKES